jgi:hypothetical protein
MNIGILNIHMKNFFNSLSRLWSTRFSAKS